MNIHKRRYSSGRVVWRARYPDPARGGKRQIERQFPTKREAEAWLASQKEAVRRGDHIDPRQANRLFHELAQEWRETWIDLEPKTISGYRSILNCHVLPRWGDIRASLIDANAVQDWIGHLSDSLHPRTVRRVHTVFRGVLKLGVERGYLRNDPCSHVRLPKASAPTSAKRIVLTASEVRDLAESIDPRFRCFLYTAAYTGMRAGEVEALRRCDVDLVEGKVRVERALKEIGAKLIFGPTKTGQVRQVTLPNFLVDLLKEHLQFVDGGPEALVFTGVQGDPIRHHNFYRRYFRSAVTARRCGRCQTVVRPKVTRACPDCGSADLTYVLPSEKHGLRFHDLRHTCATILIAAGAHPKAIQEHLGHQNIQTTFDTYGHLLPSAHEALAGALDGLYDSAVSEGNEGKTPGLAWSHEKIDRWKSGRVWSAPTSGTSGTARSSSTTRTWKSRESSTSLRCGMTLGQFGSAR